MIVWILLKVMVLLYGILISFLSSLFPVQISELGLSDVIDDFYEFFDGFSEFALNGTYFLLGSFVFNLAGVALVVYTFYYTVYIPVKFVMKFFTH